MTRRDEWHPVRMSLLIQSSMFWFGTEDKEILSSIVQKRYPGIFNGQGLIVPDQLAYLDTNVDVCVITHDTFGRFAKERIDNPSEGEIVIHFDVLCQEHWCSEYFEISCKNKDSLLPIQPYTWVNV